MKDHNLLIAQLSRSVPPVRRAPGINQRLAGWLAIALPVGTGTGLLLNRALTDWTATGAGWTALQSLLSFLLGILAVRAAFGLSIAGRRVTGWKLFLPLSTLWLVSSLLQMPASPLPVNLAEGTGCYLFLLGVATPMSLVMIASLRRTPLLCPLRSLAMAGFGVAWIAVTLLAFCHPVHFHLHDLLMHLAACVTIVLLTMVLGKRFVALNIGR